MLKNLKLLLSLRAWLKSGTLKMGGLVAMLGSAQVWLSTPDGSRIVDLIATALHVSSPVMSGILMQGIGLLILAYRAKTETGLADK